MNRRRRRLLPFDRLDRYLVRLLVGPLVAVLATLLIAQSLERLLRLVDLSVAAGAPLAGVGVMYANLVPHYLGLTLPLSFTVAIFIAAARLSEDNELDVMLASGRSLARIGAPYFALALLLLPFDLYLFANAQPLARYGYHVAVDAALQTGWNARIEAQAFIGAGSGYTFSADAVDADGWHLHGVFVSHRQADVEEVTTAASATLLPRADGNGLLLQLHDGMTLRRAADGSLSTIRFAEHRLERDLLPLRRPFRARGDSATELTLAELHQAMQRAGGDQKAAAEYHVRLARVLILPVIPLLALPLGIASRRGRRAAGIVFAMLALVALNHALQFGKSLAENGRVAAVLGVWTPFALFAGLSAWIFAGSLAWPGDNPVLRAVRAIENSVDGARARRRAGGVA